MPPKQTYGKRSRVVYDPFQAFASPQRPAPGRHIKEQGAFVAEVVEELSRLKVDEKGGRDGKQDLRKALGEKSVNETVAPVKIVLDEGKTKRRRRQFVMEDKDIEASRATVNRSLRRSGSRSHAEQRKSRTQISQDDGAFVADNVPMFVDGHGYDSEDEKARSGAPDEISPLHLNLPMRSPYNVSVDAPDISIFPPTPPAEPDHTALHCAPLLSLSAHGITSFMEWSNQLTNHFDITKIAEASFGEVYRLALLEDLSSFSHSDESVLKIIALKPPEPSLPPTSKKERKAALKKIDTMSKVEDVANEVKLLQRMSTIPGFTNFRDVRIMQGQPPQPFVRAFKDFNLEQKSRGRNASVFPDPGKKSSYKEDQLWAVIEMQDAGTDLERYVEQAQCHSVWCVWDVFWQVVLALAKGEEGAEFEHRDMHLGNICVRLATAVTDKNNITIDTKLKLNFTALETTIIDYTISRALLAYPPDPGSPSASTNDHPEIAFHDLSTPTSQAIFEGDSTEEYQYDIYRYMRGCVVAGDPYHEPEHSQPTPKTNPSSQWSNYHPRTNLIWLHYLLHTLLEQLHWPSAGKAPNRKKNGGRDFALWKRANDLEFVLLRVQELLDPGIICGVEGLSSAAALVGLALEEDWLDEGDVVGGDHSTERDFEEALEARVVGEGDTLGEAANAALIGEQEINEPEKAARTRKEG